MVCICLHPNITVCVTEHEVRVHWSRQLNPTRTFGSKINEQKTKVKLLRNTAALRGRLTVYKSKHPPTPRHMVTSDGRSLQSTADITVFRPLKRV